jgi:hypothetical protein
LLHSELLPKLLDGSHFPVPHDHWS